LGGCLKLKKKGTIWKNLGKGTGAGEELKEIKKKTDPNSSKQKKREKRAPLSLGREDKKRCRSLAGKPTDALEGVVRKAG